MLIREKEYRSLCLKIGFTLLVQFVIDYFFLWKAYDVAALFGFRLNYVGETILNSLIYMICFMLPVLFFRLISVRRRHPGMGLSVKTGKDLFLLIPAAVALIVSAAYLNGLLFSFADFSKVYVDTYIDSPASLLLEFIATAAVPAVCEEFLFRGCIESELMPYGKQNAIFFSALAFAVMHGNFAQFLYTFCAGLVIGYVYAETGSIWPGMLIHLFNNLFSVAETVLLSNSSAYFNELLLTLLETVILAAGALCLVILILRKKIVFSKDIKENELFVHSRAFYFFNPATICYICLKVLYAGFIFYIVLTD